MSKDVQIWMNKLREFTEEDNYVNFRHEVILYIVSYLKDFEINNVEIFFVLSYLKGSQVLTWLQNYINQYIIVDDILFVNTFDIFIKKLNQLFDNPNYKKKALVKFWVLIQGSRIMDDFFINFEIIWTKVVLTDKHYDDLLINWLKQVLNLNVIKHIIQTSLSLTDYEF